MPDIARSLHDMDTDRAWFADDLQERFLRYVRVYTTSDPHNAATPSTDRQFDLARMLEGELRDLGLDDVTLDDHCNLIARLPGTAPGTPIGFMAHLDTAPDFSGEGVDPQVHDDYDGGIIELNDECALDPEEYPALARYEGETVITTDGTTLLGADDKAGIAEIMTAVKYLLAHPELPRPDLEVIFTPDEETGRGMETFPVDALRSKFCVTVDGTDEGGIEAECFTAFKATVTFTGYSIHPGNARGRLANAASMASQFVAMLPRSESPEATDERYGFYCPTEINGSIARAQLTVIVRDFDMAIAKRRLDYLDALAQTIEGAFPGGSVEVKTVRQYVNMAEYLRPYPELIERLQEAIRATGVEPAVHRIRGGTDGARLSERGVPTPNLFTGGQNLHGRYEWIAIPAMVRAAKSVVNTAQLFCEE
ncbi:MAG: peptidase T [Spirochaetota bacterium]